MIDHVSGLTVASWPVRGNRVATMVNPGPGPTVTLPCLCRFNPCFNFKLHNYYCCFIIVTVLKPALPL